MALWETIKMKNIDYFTRSWKPILNLKLLYNASLVVTWWSHGTQAWFKANQQMWWMIALAFVLCWSQRPNKKWWNCFKMDVRMLASGLWFTLFLLVNVGPFYVAWPLQKSVHLLAFAGVYPSGMGGGGVTQGQKDKQSFALTLTDNSDFSVSLMCNVFRLWQEIEVPGETLWFWIGKL